MTGGMEDLLAALKRRGQMQQHYAQGMDLGSEIGAIDEILQVWNGVIDEILQVLDWNGVNRVNAWGEGTLSISGRVLRAGFEF